jgi:DNA (cytosine-5)-methyltransferase 1
MRLPAPPRAQTLVSPLAPGRGRYRLLAPVAELSSRPRRNSNGVRLRALSVFSGAGGADIGFERAGFEIIGSIERDADARSTLSLNRPSWHVHERGDINEWARALEDVPAAWCRPDVIVAGPPCQPFSKAAQWQKPIVGLADPRAAAVRSLLRLIGRLLPRVVLIENVPGFVSGRGAATPVIARYLAAIRAACGVEYKLDWRILDAADFGVPQRRRRAILILSQGPTAFDWPAAPNVNRPVSAWQALHDAPNGEVVPTPSGQWAPLLPSIPEGRNYLFHSRGQGGLDLFGARTRYWSFLLKMARARPSWTLSAQPGPATGPFHWDNRPLTIAEMKRVQTFPDDWVLAGNQRSKVRQVGNATPPLLAEHLARAVARHLGRPSPPLPAVETLSYDDIPEARPPQPVRAAYIQLATDHLAHPGEGRGPGAKKRLQNEAGR